MARCLSARPSGGLAALDRLNSFDCTICEAPTHSPSSSIPDGGDPDSWETSEGRRVIMTGTQRPAGKTGGDHVREGPGQEGHRWFRHGHTDTAGACRAGRCSGRGGSDSSAWAWTTSGAGRSGPPRREAAEVGDPGVLPGGPEPHRHLGPEAGRPRAGPRRVRHHRHEDPGRPRLANTSPGWPRSRTGSR